MVGNSSGQPPACQTPRLTASASSRKWMWQWFSSLQVWAMPMTGLARSMSSKPDALNQARRVRPQSRASSAPRVLRANESVISICSRTRKSSAFGESQNSYEFCYGMFCAGGGLRHFPALAVLLAQELLGLGAGLQLFRVPVERLAAAVGDRPQQDASVSAPE